MLKQIFSFFIKSFHKPIHANQQNTNTASQINLKEELTNTTAQTILLVLEPWGDLYQLKSGETVIITAQGPEGGKLEIDRQADTITVYGWAGSTLQAAVNGKIVCNESVPVPGVPSGMTIKDFMGVMFDKPPEEKGTGDQ